MNSKANLSNLIKKMKTRWGKLMIWSDGLQRLIEKIIQIDDLEKLIF